MTAATLIDNISQLSPAEQLHIIEAVIRKLRDRHNYSDAIGAVDRQKTQGAATHSLFQLSGTISEQDADIMQNAIEDSRQIDYENW